MNALGALPAFGLMVVTAVAVAVAAPMAPAPTAAPSIVFSPPAVDPAASPPLAAPPAPPSEALPTVPEAPPGEEYDPNMYADSIDTDVTYDDQVAQSYDDGYDPQAYSQFADALSPYGSWIDDGTYGRVWMPSPLIVGADFSPYASNGHWALTEFGWTWVSAWDWGWAPFHYGRWTTLAGRGWGWVPGTLWGPAWVSWRAGGGYVGWAPLPPRGVGLGRPIGTRSPWRFTAAGRLGAAQPTYLSSRTVPAVFARTSVVSNQRVLSMNGAPVRVNAGPARLFDQKGAPVAAARFATVAPHAVPARAISPHVGVAVASRPWAAGPTIGQRTLRQQTPVYRFAPSNRSPAAVGGALWSAGPRARASSSGLPGFVAPAGRGPVFSSGGVRPSAPAFGRPSASYVPRYQGPIYRPAPMARSYAAPFAARPFVRAPIYQP
ncbi:MAG TPA: DUF6600 domain-containing protein, partial [Polyangia bacterium]